MTDQSQPVKSKPEKKVKDLELNRETILDLTESESQAAAGGLLVLEESMLLKKTCHCINTQGCPVGPVETVKCTRDADCLVTFRC